MNDVLISVVIPVHNGAEYIENCVKGILNQSLKQIEVILVENFSSDESLSICNKLHTFDKRVKVYQSFNKGTTFARKLGVQKSVGKYITFSDQDDKYNSKKSLEKMYNTISTNGTQICQFGHYNVYGHFIKKKTHISDKIYSTKELFNDQIKGVLGIANSDFSTTVWDKIYEADLIKSAAEKINETMFFSEDEYFNVRCFFNKNLKSVSSCSDSFYCWKKNIGFSSSKDSSLTLFNDYEILKPIVNDLLADYRIDQNIVWTYNLETIYFYRSIINRMIIDGIEKNTILDTTEQLINSKSYKIAVEFFLNYKGDNNIWYELQEMISISDVNEYYTFCSKHLIKDSFLTKVKKFLF